MNKAQVGKRGEQVAARYLRRCGYDIIERNIHISHQEIDIIAINKECIAFVEVKTRTVNPNRADYRFTPGAAVTYEKQRNLLQAAAKYIRQNGHELQPRMDVIEVYLASDDALTPMQRLSEKITGMIGVPKRRIMKINHIENAFGLHGYRP